MSIAQATSFRFFLLAFLFAFLLSFGVSSKAAVNMNSLELGTGMRVEQNTDGKSLDGQLTFSLAAGVNIDIGTDTDVDLLAEFSIFSETESESILSVSRDHFEFLGWGKYTFYTRDRLDLQIGAGLGFFWESFQTQVGSAGDQASSSIKLIGGGLFGGHFRLQKNWAIGLDLRLLSNTNDSLSPVFDVMARMKYLF